MADLVFNKGIPLQFVLKVVLLIQPSILVLTIPMALLFSAILTFNRLSSFHEFTALKASGVSFYTLLKPVFLFSIVVFSFTMFLMTVGMPEGNKAFRKLVYQALKERLILSVREKIFNNSFNGLVFYVNKMSPDNDGMQGIIISDNRQSEERIITAEEGTIFPDSQAMKITLQLKNGSVHTLNKKKNSYRWMTFREYIMSLDIPWQGFNKWISERPRDLTLSELKQQISGWQSQGKNTNSLVIELQKKIALPFACFILGFLGAPLGLINPRSGKSGGFVFSLLIIFLYYILLAVGENLGGQGKLPPVLAIWTPNIIISILAGYLVIKTGRESSFSSWFRLFDKLESFALAWKRVT